MLNVDNAGWPNGVFIEERFSSGPYAGKSWYYAEHIKPTVTVGQLVSAGTPIGQNGGSSIEIGWSTGFGGNTLAAALGQIPPTGDPGGCSSASGASASRLLASLGAPLA
jgi:hypothetical protein